MMYSNVIVGITISRGSFVFSESCVKVSASLTSVGGLAVEAFDLVNCSLSVVRFIPVFHIKGTSETISQILQLYNIRVAYKPTTTLRHLLTNVQDRRT